MARKVTIDNLSSAIEDILNEYQGDIQNNVDVITAKIGKTGAQAVKNSAKKEINGKIYASGWTYKVYKHPLYSEVVIYNAKQAGLAHLLEHGHALVRGGRKVGDTSAFEHIRPVEEKLIEEYERGVKNALNEG